MISLKKFAQVFLLFAFLSSLLVSQEKPSDPHFSSEDKALLFKIEKDFTLDAFTGSSISFKKQINEFKAVRFGLSLEAESVEDDQRWDHYYSETDFHLENLNADESAFNLSLTTQLLFYGRPNDRIYPYVGIGPILQYSYADDNQLENDYLDGPMEYELRTKYKMDRFGIGASAVLGIEWFVLSNVSIIAEYNNSLIYYTVDDEQTYQYEDGETLEISQSYSELNLSDGPVMLGVSFYFGSDKKK